MFLIYIYSPFDCLIFKKVIHVMKKKKIFQITNIGAIKYLCENALLLHITLYTKINLSYRPNYKI